MSASPVSAAFFTAGATFVIGVALSWGARRVGWIKRISWVAALLAPIAVGTLVYWNAAG